MHKSVLTDPRYYNPEEKGVKKKGPKQKLSIGQSLKYIFSSPYLGCIVTLVLAYGISINLIEGVWKSQLKIAFADKNSYNAFMGKFAMLTGFATIILMIVGNNIVRILLIVACYLLQLSVATHWGYSCLLY